MSDRRDNQPYPPTYTEYRTPRPMDYVVPKSMLIPADSVLVKRDLLERAADVISLLGVLNKRQQTVYDELRTAARVGKG